MGRPKREAQGEALFESIGEEAISEAEGIRVDFESFVDGLRTIEDMIRSRRQLAEAEMNSRKENDE